MHRGNVIMSGGLHASLYGGLDSSLIILACLNVSTGFKIITNSMTHRLSRLRLSAPLLTHIVDVTHFSEYGDFLGSKPFGSSTIDHCGWVGEVAVDLVLLRLKFIIIELSQTFQV